MDAEGGLRERKKARTRADIAAAALALSARDGFAATTVGAIAARAEVAPRTFFRFFPSKEDAVLAPEADLFDAALDVLRGAEHAGGLGEVFIEAVVTATARFDDDWWRRFVVAAHLIDEVDTVEAAALRFCARTATRLREVLRPSDPSAPSHVAELALEGAVGAWRLARRDWLDDGAPDPAALGVLLRRNVAALPAAATLTVLVRPGEGRSAQRSSMASS